MKVWTPEEIARITAELADLGIAMDRVDREVHMTDLETYHLGVKAALVAGACFGGIDDGKPIPPWVRLLPPPAGAGLGSGPGA